MKGKLELNYDKNGIKFDVIVELNEKNYRSATDLMDTLTNFVNDKEVAELAEENCKKCKEFLDKVLKEILMPLKNVPKPTPPPTEETPTTQEEEIDEDLFLRGL